MISITLPTYNERENIEKVVKEIFNTVKNDTEVIIVDDNSPDGTGIVAEELAKKYNIKVLHKPKRLGLSPAVIDGFKIAKGDIIGVMDADLSHPVSLLHRFINSITSGEADIVIGSRYMSGGHVETWSLPRKIVSLGATLLAKLLVNVKDPMSGFFFMNKSVVENVHLDSKGYKILLEVLVKGNYGSLKEIPYTFKGRGIGKSKLNFKEYVKYLLDISRLYFYKALH